MLITAVILNPTIVANSIDESAINKIATPPKAAPVALSSLRKARGTRAASTSRMTPPPVAVNTARIIPAGQASPSSQAINAPVKHTNQYLQHQLYASLYLEFANVSILSQLLNMNSKRPI